MSDLGLVLDQGADPITDNEFSWIKDFLYRQTGIGLKEGKEFLVMGRLAKRLRHHGLTSYGEYFRRLADPEHAGEMGMAIDLLTTNETYFFREAVHFDLLRDLAAATRVRSRPFRVWSAASSSGEEAYSIAMTLADTIANQSWAVIGTDISSRVLETARRGLYPVGAASKIPPHLLRRFCLRGRDEYEGFLLIDAQLRQRVEFDRANLVAELPAIGLFDAIFLRNVMIYFDSEVKQQLVRRIEAMLHPGGHLIISLSESLHGIQNGLKMIKPSVYQRAGE